MPDPITHVFLRKNTLKKKFPEGSNDYYFALAAQYIPDSDLLLRVWKSTRKFYSNGKLIHRDAKEISQLSKESGLRSLQYLYMHEDDDEILHDKYIWPLSDIAVSEIDFFSKYKKPRLVAHGLIELALGQMLIEEDPSLLSDVRKSIRECFHNMADFSKVLGKYYDQNWKSFYYPIRFITTTLDLSLDDPHIMLRNNLTVNGKNGKSKRMWILGLASNIMDRLPIWLFPDSFFRIPIQLRFIRISSHKETNKELDKLMDRMKDIIIDFENRKSRNLKEKGNFRYLKSLIK